MNSNEMRECLKSLGLGKHFRPYAEPETGRLMLETRKPDRIVDGCLRGGEIGLEAGDLFRSWTPRKRLVNELAKRHSVKARLLDGEAELWIPSALADELLPKLGAKLKKTCTLTPEQREAARTRMRLLHSKQDIQGTSGVPNHPGKG